MTRSPISCPPALPALIMSLCLTALLLLPHLVAASEQPADHSGHGAATAPKKGVGAGKEAATSAQPAGHSGHAAESPGEPPDGSGKGEGAVKEPTDHSWHGKAATASGPGAPVALEERLGARIPLDLMFRDEEGRSRRLGDLITGPTIILPVYYRCTNVCNYLQGGLARILPELKPKPGDDYRVLSVSFDENETPRDAAASKRMYMTALNTPFPPDGWHFLTGDPANIRRLTDAAGYSFQRKGNDFLHPVVSFVVAGDGQIVRYLYGTSFLTKDVTLALAEARAGKSGATIKKLVEYCFTFDPKKKSYQFNLLRVSATVIILCTGSFLLYLVFSGRRKDKQKGAGEK